MSTAVSEKATPCGLNGLSGQMTLRGSPGHDHDHDGGQVAIIVTVFTPSNPLHSVNTALAHHRKNRRSLGGSFRVFLSEKLSACLGIVYILQVSSCDQIYFLLC